MASQNRLLGSGISENIPNIGHDLPPNYRAPAWRYHAELCPKGRIAKTDAELDKLDAEGWVDHIGKTARLPGLEKIWDAYQTKLVVPVASVPVVEVVLEPTEDQIKADALKAESDKVEAKRIADLERAIAGPPKCDVCGKEFETQKGVDTHKRFVHKG